MDDNSLESGPQFDIGGRKRPAPKEFPQTLDQHDINLERPSVGPNLPRRTPKSDPRFPRRFPGDGVRGGNTGFRLSSRPADVESSENIGFSGFGFPSTLSPLPIQSGNGLRHTDTFSTFGRPNPSRTSKGRPFGPDFGASSGELLGEEQRGPIGLTLPSDQFGFDDDLESPFTRPGSGTRYRLLQQYLLQNRLRPGFPGIRRPLGNGFYSVSSSRCIQVEGTKRMNRKLNSLK